MILHQGEVFGEELFSDRPLAASATSVTASLLLAIPRRTLLEVMQRVPSLQQELERVQTLHTLRRSLCSDLALAQIHDLATKATRHTFYKDESIFTQGEPAKAFYVLIQGAIALSSRNNEGVEYPITYLEGDAYFGEVELLNTTTDVREATAIVASSTCQVLRIRRDDFLTFVRAHPRLKKQMERQSSQRVLQHVVCATRATTAARSVDIVGQLDLASSRDVLLIDETKCIRCNNCVKACAATHQGQPRLNRASGPSVGQIHVPVSCRHCEGTPCLQNCPPGDAIARDADGVVQILADKCIGCGNCVESCPYKVISLVELSQQETSWVHFTNILDFLRPKKKAKHAEEHRQIAVKCDLCSHSTGGPACVHHCPTGAAIRVKHVDVPATVARLTAQVAFQ
jgi:Fe-S-cluster-containing hydrogenase component 2/CRP-like cAMP-binding protein